MVEERKGIDPTDAHVLVVEDTVPNFMLIARMLNHMGVRRCEWKTSGWQVVQYAEMLPRVDLILLDIRMNRELEGIEIAKILNDEHQIPFIFITAHSDKEIISKALEMSPLGYLIKPFKKMEVFAALNIAMTAIKKKEVDFITFKDGYETVKLLIPDILYVVSEGNYINIISTTKKYVIRYSLKWFKENTLDKGFEHVHKSYIINTTKVDRVTSKSVTIGDVEIPTSRNKSIEL